MKESSPMDSSIQDPLVHAAATNAAADDDAQLARRTVAGDQAAFDEIMRRYNQRLYRLAVSVLADAAEAEDALQESYVRAFYAMASYTGNGSFGAWLARIVRNEAIDRLRARDQRRIRIILETDLAGDAPLPGDAQNDAGGAVIDDSASARSDPHAATELAELRGTLERAIERLPEQFRAAFVLREVEGMTVEEAAQYLGIRPATVKTRDYRARVLLRGYLRESIDTTLAHTFVFLGARCDALRARVWRRLQQ
jgi:RNA polymerase sigma-70 factor, ECF subfamily